MEPTSTPAKQPPYPPKTSPTSMPPVADMSAAEFRKHGYAVIDWIADYLEAPEKWPVLPAVRPGDLRSALPQSPPERGQSMEEILGDFQRLIVPAITHWNHPAFMAYFANSSTGAGILGEALTAALNVNAMLWRTSPAATELEQLTLDWLRQMLGLPDGLFGMIADTASSNTLYALAAAREMRPELRIREEGMSGRADLPKIVVYCSEEAHSSVDKAVMTLGYGLEALRKIPTDSALRMDAGALAAVVDNDRRAGRVPLAVVATVGTTATTAIDPEWPSARNEQQRAATATTRARASPRSCSPGSTAGAAVPAPRRWPDRGAGIDRARSEPPGDQLQVVRRGPL